MFSLRTVICIALFTSLSFHANAEPLKAGSRFFGRIIRVIDGDTYVIKNVYEPSQVEKVRLHGVDTPEKGQCMGKKIARRVREWLLDSLVVVEVVDRGKYGRLIVTIGTSLPRNIRRDEEFLAQHRISRFDYFDLGYLLVSFGWAWRYTEYDTKGFYAEAQQTAYLKRRGIWSSCSPVYPQTWRKNRRK